MFFGWVLDWWVCLLTGNYFFKMSSLTPVADDGTAAKVCFVCITFTARRQGTSTEDDQWSLRNAGLCEFHSVRVEEEKIMSSRCLFRDVDWF